MRRLNQRMIAAVALVSMTLLGCGQLAKPVSEIRISCDANDECPTDYFCSETGSCTQLSERSPAKIVFRGARVDESASFAKQITLPRGEATRIQYKFGNDGDESPINVTINFDGPPCADFDFEAFGVSRLPPGGENEGNQTIEPKMGCASPATVNITMETATQSYSDQLQVNLQ